MKKLIATSTVRGELDDENFQRGLLEYRNTPRAGGLSPAQILFGHPLLSAVPAHRAAFSDKWQKTANEYDARRSRAHTQHEQRTFSFSPAVTHRRGSESATHDNQEMGSCRGNHRHRPTSRLPHETTKRSSILAQSPIPQSFIRRSTQRCSQ